MKKYTQRKLLYGLIVVAIAGLSFGGGVIGSRVVGQGRDTVQYGVPALSYATPDSGMAVPAFLGSQNNSAVAMSFQDQFRAVAATTMPVVVEVNVVNTVTQQVQSSPFDFFFGTPGQGAPQQREYTQRGLGSGVIVARNAETVYVLTNNHVAGDADEIEVVLNDGRSYSAALVGGDDLMDLALVSFETSDDLPIAVLGNSESLVVGDWVFAVGNPLGFQSTVTAGIVSAISRNAQPGSGMTGVTEYVQTDAAINQGNSGGALVNLEGEVVGINTWIASQNGGNIGLGFAIPINDAKRAIAGFIADGSVSYSWLGVQAGSVGSELAKELGIDGIKGAFVFGVYEDSPAGNAGIQPGDVITKVGNTAIADSSALVRTIAAIAPEAETEFSLVRGGQNTKITIKTARRSDSSGSDVSNLWPGLSVAPMTDQIKEQLSVSARTSGVVVTAVTPESAAANSGLRQGDVITAVNETRISSAIDFYRSLNANADEVQFRVERGGNQLLLGFAKPAA